MLRTKEEYDFEPFAKTKDYLKVNRKIVKRWTETMFKKNEGDIDRILDIATGTGTMVELLFSFLPSKFNRTNVICLDKSAEALDSAERNLLGKVQNLELIQAPIEDAKLSPRSVDIAIWGNGIHYLSEEGQKNSIRNISRVLKPNGWFFFNTSFYDGARPTETLPFYRAQVKKAVEYLRSRDIRRDKKDSRPEASKFHTKLYYEELLALANFKIIESKEFSVDLYKRSWEQISSFGQYAAGALHGYKISDAAIAMKKAVKHALEHHGQHDGLNGRYIRRNWLAISARV